MKKSGSQIFVVDFGSQYTHLIADLIRRLGVQALVCLPTVSKKELLGAKGLIFSGGPQSVYDKNAVKYNPELFKLNVPILGLCYGHQLLAQSFGGKVLPGQTKEYGFAKIKRVGRSPLFAGLNKTEQVWMSHGDAVSQLPKDFLVIGQTADCPVAAMANETKKIYGLQFHPEVAHTTRGKKIFQNFVFSICGCKKDWSEEIYWQHIAAYVKETVGKRKVFVLISGGVDSAVCFAALQKILGPARVMGLHIDNGFMRLNESSGVIKALQKAGFKNIRSIDESERFLTAVAGVADPEEKRKIIGRLFIDVASGTMKQFKLNPNDWILGQGTIYPDTIESGATKHSATIKTHHNRVPIILKMIAEGKIVEPIRTLYKDEVRRLGKKLSLPRSMLERHPFPGPGLSIRALCSDGKDRVDEVQNINTRLAEIVKGSRLTCAVLPIKSVGVQGDNRTYRHPAVLSGKADWQTLHDFSVEITNKVPEVNRVIYLLNPKIIDLQKFQVKPATLTRQRLDQLRNIDDFMMRQIKKRRTMYRQIWQFPVILVPLGLGSGESVILRPIESSNAMTVSFYRMDWKTLWSFVEEISGYPGIDAIFYDVTNKPPGTIEWE